MLGSVSPIIPAATGPAGGVLRALGEPTALVEVAVAVAPLVEGAVEGVEVADTTTVEAACTGTAATGSVLAAAALGGRELSCAGMSGEKARLSASPRLFVGGADDGVVGGASSLESAARSASPRCEHAVTVMGSDSACAGRRAPMMAILTSMRLYAAEERAPFNTLAHARATCSMAGRPAATRMAATHALRSSSLEAAHLYLILEV